MCKRFFDLLLVVIFAPLWGLLLAAVALAVRVKLGRPIFFRQARPGLRGRIFTLLKFRTMQGDGSIPAFGRRLRTSSLDELPQLINVLRGEMSLVGPRPLLVEYLDRYTPEQKRRHDVRPGITGWAQVNGRNTLAWEEKFRLDVWYVEHQSLWFDMKILALTVARIFQRRGINASENETMPVFHPQTHSK